MLGRYSWHQTIWAEMCREASWIGKNNGWTFVWCSCLTVTLRWQQAVSSALERPHGGTEPRQLYNVTLAQDLSPWHCLFWHVCSSSSLFEKWQPYFTAWMSFSGKLIFSAILFPAHTCFLLYTRIIWGYYPNVFCLKVSWHSSGKKTTVYSLFPGLFAQFYPARPHVSDTAMRFSC